MKNIWHEKANEQILPNYHCCELAVQCLMTNLLKTLNVHNFSLKRCTWCYGVKDSSCDAITHFLYTLVNCKSISRPRKLCLNSVSQVLFGKYYFLAYVWLPMVCLAFFMLSLNARKTCSL